tara:strand:+ start:62 stop:1108 length:1047 start_codon:yes stop_codon:yes gene_type:complete
MKNLKFIVCILIILFKTGNVLSNNNIFNVNNVEINKEIYKNNEKLVNQAFRRAFDQLLNRVLLKEDYKKFSNISLNEIKELILYYQIINPDKNDKSNFTKINVFFDKDKMHNFFNIKNVLYSDIVNTEVVLFPLLKKDEKYFIYTKNYFYENWNKKDYEELIQYILPSENIESIEAINTFKDNIFKLNVSNFFKEYESENVVFLNIDINKNVAKILVNTRIEGKKINKNILIKNKKNFTKNEFNNHIILSVNNVIADLIKSQNLIDVKTPSFLNVAIKLDNKKSNLAEFNNRVKKIDLIDNYYVQQINKDYVLIKIRYLGKINKIINKLKKQNIDLKMIKGQWQLNII